jgi:hypothetical protein
MDDVTAKGEGEEKGNIGYGVITPYWVRDMTCPRFLLGNDD